MHARAVTRLGRAGLLAAVLSGIVAGHAWAVDPPKPPIVVTPGSGQGQVGIGVYAPGGGNPSGNGGGATGGNAPGGGNPSGNGGGGSVVPVGATGGTGSAAGGNGNPFIPGNLPVTGPFFYCPPDLNNPAWVAACNPPAAPAAPAGGGAPAPPPPPPPPPSIALAQAAWGQLVMPSPVPSRYPSGTLKTDGHPYTLVNANTWFWTDPATWQPVSKTVTAGAVWGKATATPVSLGFTPGDGSRTVTCTGPGSAWVANEQTWVAPVNPQGCSYRYPKSSLGVGGDNQVTSTYTITWKVTWTGSDGTSGTFNNMQTQTTSRFAVAELQTVVTR